MSLFFISIFNQFKNWIIGVGAVILIILGAFYKGKSAGREDAVEKDRKELQKDVQLKNKIKQDVASDSDDDVNKRLRKWVKD